MVVETKENQEIEKPQEDKKEKGFFGKVGDALAAVIDNHPTATYILLTAAGIAAGVPGGPPGMFAGAVAGVTAAKTAVSASHERVEKNNNAVDAPPSEHDKPLNEGRSPARSAEQAKEKTSHVEMAQKRSANAEVEASSR